MKCQECEKRPASLHFTQVINGNKTEVHVCEDCAKQKGYMSYPSEGYSLHNLLSGLFHFENQQMGNSQQTSFPKKDQLQCPKCHLTLGEFQRIGKFGCSHCYQAFGDKIDPILRRVHSGNTKHSGKIPKRKGGSLHTKKKLETYRTRLRQLIEREEFEEAAKVRDIIKDLEKKTNGSEAGEEL